MRIVVRLLRGHVGGFQRGSEAIAPLLTFLGLEGSGDLLQGSGQPRGISPRQAIRGLRWDSAHFILRR